MKDSITRGKQASLTGHFTSVLSLQDDGDGGGGGDKLEEL